MQLRQRVSLEEARVSATSPQVIINNYNSGGAAMGSRRPGRAAHRRANQRHRREEEGQRQAIGGRRMPTQRQAAGGRRTPAIHGPRRDGPNIANEGAVRHTSLNAADIMKMFADFCSGDDISKCFSNIMSLK